MYVAYKRSHVSFLQTKWCTGACAVCVRTKNSTSTAGRYLRPRASTPHRRKRTFLSSTNSFHGNTLITTTAAACMDKVSKCSLPELCAFIRCCHNRHSTGIVYYAISCIEVECTQAGISTKIARFCSPHAPFPHVVQAKRWTKIWMAVRIMLPPLNEVTRKALVALRTPRFNSLQKTMSCT